MSAKLLIVNADDLGWTEGVNEGIFAAHVDGIVSSATLMVNAPGAEHAAAALDRPELESLGVGVHVALSGGGRTTLAASEVPSLVDEEGRLPRRPEGLEGARPSEVLAEVHAQVARFETLTGRRPTHLDGHHHIHARHPEVLAAVIEAARAAGLPVRPVTEEMRARLRAEGIATPDAFDESFYAEGATRDRLTGLLRRLGPGVSEIMCHPGRVDAALERSSTYVADRERELEILTDPELHGLLAAENLRLVSYVAL